MKLKIIAGLARSFLFSVFIITTIQAIINGKTFDAIILCSGLIHCLFYVFDINQGDNS